MTYHLDFDIEFLKNPYKGVYIAFEGIDGSGKTTQVEKLAAYFRSQGKEVVTTREPRKETGIVGKLIYEILQAKKKVPSVALQYLFTADRVLHYLDIIEPALKKGSIVISDRCFWSAIPYGIMDRVMDSGEEKYDFREGKIILVAQSILSMYHQFIVPDYTFYLKVPVDTGLSRTGKKDAVKEIYETKEKLEKICKGYEWLIREFPKEITEINGETQEETVFSEIKNKLSSIKK